MVDDPKKRRGARDVGVPIAGPSVEADGTIDAADRAALAGDYSDFASTVIEPPPVTEVPPPEVITPTEPTIDSSVVALQDAPNLIAPIQDTVPIKNATLDFKRNATWTNYFNAETKRVNDITKAVVGLGSTGADPHIQSYAPGSFTITSGHFAIMADNLTLTADEEVQLEGDAELLVI